MARATFAADAAAAALEATVEAVAGCEMVGTANAVVEIETDAVVVSCGYADMLAATPSPETMYRAMAILLYGVAALN